MATEMKIGEQRPYNEKYYICLKGDCTKCAFPEDNEISCTKVMDKLGECQKDDRTDATRVYFKRPNCIDIINNIKKLTN